MCVGVGVGGGCGWVEHDVRFVMFRGSRVSVGFCVPVGCVGCGWFGALLGPEGTPLVCWVCFFWLLLAVAV